MFSLAHSIQRQTLAASSHASPPAALIFKFQTAEEDDDTVPGKAYLVSLYPCLLLIDSLVCL